VQLGLRLLKVSHQMPSKSVQAVLGIVQLRQHVLAAVVVRRPPVHLGDETRDVLDNPKKFIACVALVGMSGLVLRVDTRCTLHRVVSVRWRSRSGRPLRAGAFVVGAAHVAAVNALAEFGVVE
jgi:hypothetical protein